MLGEPSVCMFLIALTHAHTVWMGLTHTAASWRGDEVGKCMPVIGAITKDRTLTAHAGSETTNTGRQTEHADQLRALVLTVHDVQPTPTSYSTPPGRT